MPAQTPPQNKKQGYGADPPHAYGLLTPRFWHGMLPEDYLRMLAKNRFGLSFHGAATSTTILMAGVAHHVGRLFQRGLYGKRLKTAKPDQPPLFVLGHWRSGTTLLHELLIRDPRHTYPTTYECFTPHHFLVSEKWAAPLVGWLLPEKRPMDNVAAGWDRPQEDEFALCSLGLPSPYLVWAFPRNGPVATKWLTLDVAEHDRQRWIAALQGLVGAIAVSRQGRVVLKSPPHTARVRTLLEAFPDARFVHITRDPMVLFPSTVRLWKSLCDVQTLQGTRTSYDWIEEEVLSNLERMYDAFESDRTLIPEGRLAELKYEDLIADPSARLQEVYEQLDLGDYSVAKPAVDAYLSEQRDYKTNRYALPEEVESRVRDRWSSYAERYGY